MTVDMSDPAALKDWLHRLSPEWTIDHFEAVAGKIVREDPDADAAGVLDHHDLYEIECNESLSERTLRAARVITRCRLARAAIATSDFQQAMFNLNRAWLNVTNGLLAVDAPYVATGKKTRAYQADGVKRSAEQAALKRQADTAKYAKEFERIKKANPHLRDTPIYAKVASKYRVDRTTVMRKLKKPTP